MYRKCGTVPKKTATRLAEEENVRMIQKTEYFLELRVWYRSPQESVDLSRVKF